MGFLYAVTVLLARTEQYPEAAKKCEEALALDPPGRLADFLKYVHQWLLDKVEGLTGSGAGFCVAKGGYIVTTREVLRPKGKDAKKIMVRLPNYDKPVSAKLIEADAKTQIALLQVDLPAGVSLKPVPLGQKATQAGGSAPWGSPIVSIPPQPRQGGLDHHPRHGQPHAQRRRQGPRYAGRLPHYPGATAVRCATSTGSWWA